ncbi:hypothetical protein PSTG_01659 [Puccinia striiformis f. sp. tritici PST-78]|uniref:Uncharacterized protein n=1 Tax=Puccinia striiformis f. sp. tritici PST-78 TaxID=1165861 RepID=A0A0L0W1B2_9BASI|nr:hypothetical protein PSTG_01659 [Puccinia striiformis f. sp. tritici PST-78]
MARIQENNEANDVSAPVGGEGHQQLEQDGVHFDNGRAIIPDDAELRREIEKFEANYGYEPTYGGIPSAKQCLPAVEERMTTLNKVQEELKFCLEEAQSRMKLQFNQHVKKTPQWKSGDKVRLSSKHISTSAQPQNLSTDG